jgi:transcription elongation factor GreB
VQEVDPEATVSEVVMFGATVTIRDEEDNERTYAIVGIDEVDVALGRISYASPLGSSLMKARVGDWVQFRSPRGLQEIEIVAILYQPLP